MTTETGVEYTLVTIGDKSILIRGAEKRTTIPKNIIDDLIKNHGTLDCHSHPFIGDLSPSLADRNLLNTLNWQRESVIIEPSQALMRYSVHGVIGEDRAPQTKESNFYDDIFGEGN